jgi:multidrug efflux pump
MNACIDFCLSHVRTALFCLAFLLVAGMVSYLSIPKESNPDVKIPYIFVSMDLEGISPEDGDRLLLRPMEQKLRNIEGLKEIGGCAYPGGAYVVLEFNAGLDIDSLLLKVRNEVDMVKGLLPEDTKTPLVEEINLSLFPVLIVQLSGSVPERTLYRIAQQLQDKIEALNGVLKAPVYGKRDEVVEITLNPIHVETYGLSLGEIIEKVNQNHLMVPTGRLRGKSGAFLVKLPGLLESVEEMKEIPIKMNKDIVVRLKDIATIRSTFKDPLSLTRDRGENAISLQVSKRTGENIIETIKQVRDVVEKESHAWKDYVHVTFAQDESKDIFDMLMELQNSIISAVILVMIVIIATLGVRSSLLVGIAIPGSFLMGILALALLKMTLNGVVLFSLILSVGMLVDGAIIVVEYADRKMMEGIPKLDAYRQAAKRMAWPVISSTATIIVVFMPLLFWPGVMGQFMKYLPITLIATLSASLVMALLFVPALGSLFGAVTAQDLQAIKAIVASEDGPLSEIKGFTGKYISLLSDFLNYPLKILGIAFLILVAVIASYIKWGHGVEFFPKVEPPKAAYMIHGRGNLSLEEKDRLVRQVENRLLDIPYFKTVYTYVGPMNTDQPEDGIGEIVVEFIDWQERPRAEIVLEEGLERVKDIPGIYVEIQRENSGPSQGKPIEIQVASDKDLILETQKVKHLLESIEGLMDVDANLPLPGIEWNFKVNRAEAAKYGSNIEQVGRYIQLVTDGLKLAKYHPDESREEVDIVIRHPEVYRHAGQLENIKVVNEQGIIPISNFVSYRPQQRITNIYKKGGSRALTVSANVKADVLVDAKVKEIQAKIQTIGLNPDTKIEFKGEEEDKQETSAFLLKSFGIAIFLILIILVTQFNSFFDTLLILSSVVLSTIGVFIGLLVTGQPFGIVMGGIGVIALAGIIVSNNIILIDTFNQLKITHAEPIRDLILRTGAQRLRPVILTKLTTILGLLPIFFRLDLNFLNAHITMGAPSSEWWVQLATAIIFGVMFASVLTLVVTPCALMLKENYLQKRRQRVLEKNAL